MVSAYSRWAGVRSVSISRPVIPMTPFIGVRISWLMFARNSLLLRAESRAASRARESSISLSLRWVMSFVTPRVPTISPLSSRTGILVVSPHDTLPSVVVSFSDRSMMDSPVLMMRCSPSNAGLACSAVNRSKSVLLQDRRPRRPYRSARMMGLADHKEP